MAALDRTFRPCLALSLALAVALCGATLASGADAASLWVTPSEPVASPILLRSAPVVAMDEAGESTELWLKGEGEGLLVESATRPDGGAWAPSVTVPGEGRAEDPVLAVSPAGEATAAWVDYREGESPQVWVSQRPPGGTWGGAVPLGGAVEQRGVHGLSVDVDADGDAVVAWYEYPEERDEQWLEVDTRHASSWSPPERISHEGGARGYEHPMLATDGHGGFIAVWAEAEYNGEETYSVVADELQGGVWQGNQTLMSGHEPLGEPQLAENSAGEAIALWMNYQQVNLDSASLRGGQWNLQLIEGVNADDRCHVPQPQVGIDAAGNSTASWVDNGGNVFTDTLAAAGAWMGISQITQFAEGSSAQDLSLREDPAGDAALVWNRDRGPQYVGEAVGVEGSYRTATHPWETPAVLSTEGEYESEPSLAMDARGDALTSWGANLGESIESELSYAYVGAPSPIAPGAADDATGSSSVTSTGSGTPGLAPVYLVLPHSRLHLRRGSRMLTATIRNRNTFPVSGTATMSWFMLARGGAHAARVKAPAAIATVAHFSLPADASSEVSFRLSSRALRRLFAYVPDAGHDLVSIRLSVQGANGEHSSGNSVYALDAPPSARVHRHRLHVPPGYRAPVDPWVDAHAAC